MKDPVFLEMLETQILEYLQSSDVYLVKKERWP